MSLIATLKKLATLLEATFGTREGRAVFHEGKASPDEVIATSLACLDLLSRAGEVVGLGTVTSIVVHGATTSIIIPKENMVASITVAERIDGQNVVSLIENEQWKFTSPPPSPSNLNPLTSRTPKQGLTVEGKSPLTEKSSISPGETLQSKLKAAAGIQGRKSPPLPQPNVNKTVVPAPPMAIPRTSGKKPKTMPTLRSSTTQQGLTDAGASILDARNAADQSTPKASTTMKPSGNAHIETLRLSLFCGDLSDLNGLKSKIVNQKCFSDKVKERRFLAQVDDLSAIIFDLLQNKLDVEKKIESLLSATPEIDISIRWAAFIWQSRLLLARGRIDEAEEVARQIYQLTHEFDNASRAASFCLIAEVYLMANKQENALKVINTARNIVNKTDADLLKVALALVESQIFAVDRKYVQSAEAAKVALEIFPQISYPRIVLARLAVLNGDVESARTLYAAVLEANSSQPDALLDMSFLDGLESGSVPADVIETYFMLRELAPTRDRVAALRDAVSSAPDFSPLRNLLVWRLIGLGDSEKSILLHHPDSSTRTGNRFKPSVVIGYSASSIITSRYIELDAYITSMTSPKGTSAAASDSISPQAICLSLPPEAILKIVEKQDVASLFSGELKAFSMPDLLEFLRNGKRTGSLICSSEQGVGAIELQDGSICSAIVPDVDNIGTLLLERGLITRKALVQAIDAQEKDISGAKLGVILSEKGLVDVAMVKEILIEQTFSAIRTMISWTDGRFIFTPVVPNESVRRSLDINLDARFVLMELFREFDEARK
jgi:tetratricopeptide (TPR) repeat protein